MYVSALELTPDSTTKEQNYLQYSTQMTVQHTKTSTHFISHATNICNRKKVE